MWSMNRSYGTLNRLRHQQSLLMKVRMRDQIVGTIGLNSLNEVPNCRRFSQCSNFTKLNYDDPISTENPLLLLATSGSSASTMELNVFNPSHQVINLVHLIHDMTGGSYAASIALATVSIRVFLLLPLDVISRKERVKWDVIVDRHRQLSATQKKVDMKSLYSLYDYNPTLSSLAPVSSILLLFTMLWGLSNVPASTTEFMGGVLWCEDLTKPDPIRFLPIFSATTLILMGEVGADTSGKQPKYMWLWRALRVAIFPITVDMPATVFCFWIPNNLISLFQTAFLNQSDLKNKWWDDIVSTSSNKQNQASIVTHNVRNNRVIENNDESEIHSTEDPKNSTTVHFSFAKNKKIQKSMKRSQRKTKKSKKK